MVDETITVEVAFALPDKQRIIALQVKPGTTAVEAAVQSGIDKVFPEIDLEQADMGVFGKSVKPATYILEAGERVEIYRPLIIDPKEVRKKRAADAAAKKAAAKT
ncbi:MAG: RnfH family protein [Pseudomonadales bacterium]